VETTELLALALVPLVAAYVVACFKDPLRFALPPYAVLIPFSNLFAVAPGPFGSVSSLLGLLLGVALVAQLITTRRGSTHVPLAVPVWLAFLAVCGLSIFWSIAPRVTAEDVAVLASNVVLFAVLVLTRFDQTAFRRFATALVLGGVLVVAYGLAHVLFLGGLPVADTRGGSPRFGDDLLGANNQAAALLLPLAIATARVLTEAGRSRLLHIVATLMLLAGIIMTGSRGGLIATVVVLATVLWLSPARRALRVGLAVAAAVLLALVLIVQPGGFGQRQVDRAENSSGRTDIWAVGLHACKLYCLEGTGWGGFPVMYEQELIVVSDARIQERGATFEPHNIFLLAVIEVGVLGLVLVLVGIGVALVSAMRLPRSMRAPPVAAVLGTVVSSFFLSNLGFKFFWAVLTYVAVAETVAAASRAREARMPLARRDVVPAGEGGQ
jgi:O-antigen ligase